MHRALVAQIHILANRQPHRVLVRQDGAARGLWLADHVRRSHVVEEAVVDTAGVPRVDAVGAAERGVTDERVAAAVVVFGFVVCAVVVLLRARVSGYIVSWGWSVGLPLPSTARSKRSAFRRIGRRGTGREGRSAASGDTRGVRRWCRSRSSLERLGGRFARC